MYHLKLQCMKKIGILILFFQFVGLCLLKAEVKVAGLFGNNMVLQRERPVKIWGQADKNEMVEVSFKEQTLKTRANRKGEWQVTLAPMSHGGPYSLEVKGKNNTIRYDNILVGDVWLCSGQSNMEWVVSLAGNAQQEIEDADYPMMRSLNVPKSLHVIPQQETQGSWDVCSPSTVGNFSAVAYFYARELYRKLGIPIGIINSSWGGTVIEAWISPDVYEALPADVQRPEDTGMLESIRKYMKANKGKTMKDYQEAVAVDKGMTGKWYAEATDVSSWDEMQIPQEWGTTPLAAVDGHVWFRLDFTLPEANAGKPAVLHLGRIDDNDISWVNGKEVGYTNGYGEERIYNIPAGLLKAGKNSVTVRVTDDMGPGGFIGEAKDVYLEIGAQNVSLAGKWKYNPSLVNESFHKASLSPNTIHSSLYNSMIHPFTQFPIKGAIWYQGESNTDMPVAYQTLFPTLINDWRDKWGYEFPFYWVQLANFMEKDLVPVESGWSGVRDAQQMTLSLPQTGQAVIIDIGEAGNIHPANKQEVGRRLALNAFNKTYGYRDVIFSGPTVASIEKKGDKVLLTFDTHGSALDVKNKYGFIEGFTLAGADGKYEWAKAWIDNGKVVVWSEKVPAPAFIRYGWGNNPDVNLFNKEGLPASPFSTAIGK